MELWKEERALKPSQWGEIMTMRPNKQVMSEELLCLNGTTMNCASASEDFSVECFLDLSNGGSEDVLIQENQEEEEEEEEEVKNSSNSCSLSSDSFLMDEFAFPVDDVVAELEWVSRFVDDSSLPELSLLLPERKAKPDNQTRHLSEPEAVGSVLSKKPHFSFPVPVRPRTRRTHKTKTNLGSLSTSLSFTNSVPPTEAKPIDQKPKTKSETVQTNKSSIGNMFQRRCSHCRAHKTPQWRTGPLGAKTLCNACGVRYKSGRLCPEYRPIRSPTFSGEIHSNSHRKVLELRKREELAKLGTELTEP